MRNTRTWRESEPMNPEQMEVLEQTAFEMVKQALRDYAVQASHIFSEELDKPQDIAEDVTREAIEAMGLPQLRLRLYGKVDIKKAVYVFLPEAHSVALMLDAKAEKLNGNRTATIQMSQTSMRVRMKRGGKAIDEPGRLPTFFERDNRSLYVVTIFAKYIYDTLDNRHVLRRVIAACLPNGRLQERYNPDEHDTIWRAGRNAPTLGEDFRVRINFSDLRRKAAWRVADIPIPSDI